MEVARMNRIREIDYANRRAVVQPGVINVKLSQAVAARGYHYAPDPSSQTSCTIGGNVAENAGGPPCLKYRATPNHILGLTPVLPTGEVVRPVGKGPRTMWSPTAGPLRGEHSADRLAT